MTHDLKRIVRDARRRWRLRLALRGGAILAVAGLGLFLLATWGMDRLRFDDTAVLLTRLLAWGTFVVLAWRVLVRPLARRVDDERVALYLEEHEPGFEGHLLSAITFADRDDPATSRRLVDRLVQRAVERSERLPAWREIERPAIRRASGALAGSALAGLALLLFSPGFGSYGAPFLLRPFGTPDARSPYAIDVVPGDTVLARGADFTVSARLVNFESQDVELAIRRGEGDWERWPMPLNEGEAERTLLVFAIDSQASYFVEAARVRSPVYTVGVEDLPYVSAMDLEYRFPAYTGLSPRREDGGDIAALAGTRVRVRATPTVEVDGGAMVVGADTLPLAPDSGASLSATITVTEPGTYRVLFPAPDGRLVVASPDYFIDVLDDQPPQVRFTEPGRDMDVTRIDEVFLNAEADDDFGVARLELVYSVNGGEERTVPLYGATVRKSVSAGHTLFLEEFDIRPGDFVSYYARATDARPGAGPVLTDIYFLSIRPFDRAFREAEQQGGQGGGAMPVGELSGRQRQIVAGTFKVMRDRTDLSDAEFRDHMTTLALSQGRLREEVETLERRIRSRGIVAMDSAMAPVSEALPIAVEEMRRAEVELGNGAPDRALRPEQRALQQVQRAEAVFQREQEVSRNNRDQPGGGGGQGAISDELSELFELEADKLRNQYEQADRNVREQVNQQVDETLEKLRQLAQRQQQQNERRRAETRQQGGAGTPSDAQRRLADETEELARELERLSRERSRPDLADAARRIQAAADAMRQAAAARQNHAPGAAADERLDEARRRLEDARAAGLAENVQDALARARRLRQQQSGIERDVDRLDGMDPAERNDRVRQLTERKNLMADEVGSLEDQLEQIAREAQAEDPDAAGSLRDAARGIRQNRLTDKIRYSRGVIAQRSGDYAGNLEESIGADLDSLTRRIETAQGALGESPEEQLDRTLDRTRELANALESVRERMEEVQGEAGQTGQEGETGQAERARQLARELGERRRQLEDIRQQLEELGVPAGELGSMLRALGRYDNPGEVGTPRALEDLAGTIIPGLKEFEFALRRALLAGDDDAAVAAGAERVAPEYRAMVEEYYRRLGNRR